MTIKVGDLIKVKEEFRQPCEEDPDDWVYLIIDKVHGYWVDGNTDKVYDETTEFFRVLDPDGCIIFFDMVSSVSVYYEVVK